jgi:hypothetical protein
MHICDYLLYVLIGGAPCVLPRVLYTTPNTPSLFMFRQLLPDEAPEVTYETATYFASTMVNSRQKFKKINPAGVVCPKYDDFPLFLI